ncbi:MAG: LamG-like jellyroll fold domain-containing protein [Planctomycetota bacterium]|jgi:hypothetical protein
MSMTSAYANVVELWGDQRIDNTQTWSGNHYKIYGNLTIGPSGELTIEDSTIEIMCTYALEFSIEVEGTLRTTNCVIGGTTVYLTVIHSRITIQGGWWYATDTTIQYSYGLGFHWKKPSYLRATRLSAGTSPDAIIIGGRADVIVRDSIFEIGVRCDASAGGTTTLEFPVDTPITMVYDKNNCPGATYRMELINTTVPMWFLLLSNVSSDGPITTYNLRSCPYLIVTLFGHNLRGSASLPACYDVESDHWYRYLPTNTHISVGSLRINALNDRVNLACWTLHLDGGLTDFTITGSTYIAELWTHDGAVCRVLGEPDTRNAYLSCTTLAARDDSKILVRNATIGGLDNIGNIGQISAFDNSSIVFEDSVVGYTLLIPRDGDIEFINCMKYAADAEITELSGGGRIRGRIGWSYRPTAHYEFESDALDSAGSNHGTVHGASFVSGQVGSLAAHFDGVNDYIEIPCIIHDDFIIAFWVRTTSTAGTGSWLAGDGFVDGMDAYSTDGFATALIGGKFGFRVNRAVSRSRTTTLISSTDINDDQWHRVVATRNARTGEMKIYVDWVEEAGAVGPTGPVEAASALRIGCRAPGLDFFAGDIDDLLLCDYVPGSGLLSNASFEQDEAVLNDRGWIRWCTWNPTEGAGSNAMIVDTESIDGTRSLRIEPRGTKRWHFIVLYQSFPADVDKGYTTSFWAKAEAARPLTVQMKAADNSIEAWGATDFELTTEWTEFAYTSEVLHANVRLEILCAGSEVPFWLDRVSVYEAD